MLKTGVIGVLLLGSLFCTAACERELNLGLPDVPPGDSDTDTDTDTDTSTDTSSSSETESDTNTSDADAASSSDSLSADSDTTDLQSTDDSSL